MSKDCEKILFYLILILINDPRGTLFYEKYKFCGTEAENLARFNTTECVRYPFPAAAHREICQYRNTTVLKVIRLKHIKELMKIKNIKKTDISVIHSVRDPRAIMSSRRIMGRLFFYWNTALHILEEEIWGLKKTKLFSWEIYNYCYENMEIIRFAEAHPWLRERYMRVTHRELSVDPIKTAEKVYDFLNLTLTDELKNFLLETTKGSKDLVSVIKNKFLSTSQNSSEVLDKWKHMEVLGVDETYTIESQCREVLEGTGEKFSVDRISNSLLQQVYMG